MLPSSRNDPNLLWAFGGAGAGLLVWGAGLLATAARQGRTLVVEVSLRKQHIVQACAQASIFIYWGYYWREVYDFAHLIAAQLAFAYAFDALLTWSRRDTYVLGFGPFPIIFSINLFLWFKPDWFYLQFLMVAVGFAAKELIRWTKDGRSTHIFNPSSFPLSIFSIALILTGTTDHTWGVDIATTQLYPPYIFLLIFSASLPGQYLFGVASMTLSAVATTYGLCLAYGVVTGSPFFVDPYIPIAVFLGMHLLFNDPSTSPRSDLGRVLFGMLYGSSVLVLFALLGQLGIPTFYDKLLAVPFLNLMIQLIDRLARSPLLRGFDPGAMLERLLPIRRNLAYMALWAALFAVMQSLDGAQIALARADTLLSKGRVVESIERYRALLEAEPDHPAAHANLGYALVQEGRVQEALPLLSRALALNPGEREAQMNLAVALMQVGQREAAVQALQGLVALDPTDAIAHYNLALIFTTIGDPAAAIEAFNGALRVRPDWPPALGGLAWLHATDARVYNPERALQLAMRAAELSESRDLVALDALAAAYAAVGRFEEATEAAEAAVTLAIASAP